MATSKRLTSIIACLMLVVTIFSCIPFSAMAASTVKSVTHNGKEAGNFSTYIYVKTGSTSKSKKVDLKMTQGELFAKYNRVANYKDEAYGAYEIKIRYWDGNKWVCEKKYDVYNEEDCTVTLKKSNTYYSIQVYHWAVKTVFTSYYNNKEISRTLGWSVGNFKDIKWSTNTTYTATPQKGCTMYNGKPLSQMPDPYLTKFPS